MTCIWSYSTFDNTPGNSASFLVYLCILRKSLGFPSSRPFCLFSCMLTECLLGWLWPILHGSHTSLYLWTVSPYKPLPLFAMPQWLRIGTSYLPSQSLVLLLLPAYWMAAFWAKVWMISGTVLSLTMWLYFTCICEVSSHLLLLVLIYASQPFVLFAFYLD